MSTMHMVSFRHSTVYTESGAVYNLRFHGERVYISGGSLDLDNLVIEDEDFWPVKGKCMDANAKDGRWFRSTPVVKTITTSYWTDGGSRTYLNDFA